MSSASPLVTVCTITCNSVRTVERAIKSVINQSYQNLELLIFDANSDDGTPKILENFARRDSRIRIFLHETRESWTVSARLGLQYAGGGYFMFLDGDDFVDHNYVNQLVYNQQVGASIGAMGKLLHCDTDDRYVVGHPAFGRVFKFANARSRYTRLKALILEPDGYGSANLLYSLWSTSELREIGLRTAGRERIDDDYLFCLRALSRGPIESNTNTWICRHVINPTQHEVKASNPQIASQLTTSYQKNFGDWTYPRLVQIFRFIKSDWRNLLVIFPTLLRICIATAALPSRIFRKAFVVLDYDRPKVNQ